MLDFGPSCVVPPRRRAPPCKRQAVTTPGVKLVLRGGPGDGLTVTTSIELDGEALAVYRSTGYTYRDSGRSFKGLRIFDWLPAIG
jgi:hypothetical protein